MVWAVMTLAFFGFLRIGELTCHSPFNPERHLTFSDLVFMPKSSPKYVLVRLKVPKQTLLARKAVAIWPVTGQGVENTKWLTVLYSQ